STWSSNQNILRLKPSNGSYSGGAGARCAAHPARSEARQTSVAGHHPVLLLRLFVGLPLLTTAISPPAVDELPDQTLEHHRRLGHRDLVAGFEDFGLAAELQRHVAIAEQTGRHDRRGRVDREFEARIEVQRDAGPVVVAERDGGDLSDLDAGDDDLGARLE